MRAALMHSLAGFALALFIITGCDRAADKQHSVAGDTRPSPSVASSQVAPAKPTQPGGASSSATAQSRSNDTQAPEGMIHVPGGVFDMGMPKSITHGAGPKRTQVVGFFIDRTEVTVAAYRACVDAEDCSAPARGSNCNAKAKHPLVQHPMNCVSKDQAEQFCKAQQKRLPTSAEWEFAARGTDGRTYPWGNEEPVEQLCWQGRAGAASKKTCPVGNFPAGTSPFGAVDMAGNVAEWTSTADAEAAGPGAFYTRGGGYTLRDIDRADPDFYAVRADQPMSLSGSDALPDVGFRCAKDL